MNKSPPEMKLPDMLLDLKRIEGVVVWRERPRVCSGAGVWVVEEMSARRVC
jgi:hypothetical protein